MKIGIIGSGKIGSLLGRLWVQAGHEVRFSSRHPEKLAAFARELGERASTGSSEDAARFGEVLLVSVPYAALPSLGQQLGDAIAGRIVLESGNPYPQRDGDVAHKVIDSGQGTGVWSARFLPGARVVRAFNTVWDKTLAQGAHRKGDRIGIPLASDDRDALDVTARLVKDAGFDPVVVGGLDTAKRFDVGTSVYNTGMSGPEVRRELGLDTESLRSLSAAKGSSC
jgi:8-hydroxy-5-deazaflavin:NADPH oxidoreductase